MTPAERFVADGWLVVDLHDPTVAHEIAAQLLAWLRADGLPALDRLDDYHLHVTDAAEHDRLQWALATRYWDARLGHRIVAGELEWLRGFVGLDLHVQRHPYLRVARPGQPGDAVRGTASQTVPSSGITTGSEN